VPGVFLQRAYLLGSFLAVKTNDSCVYHHSSKLCILAHAVFVFFLRFLQQTTIMSLCCINWLFAMVMDSFDCVV